MRLPVFLLPLAALASAPPAALACEGVATECLPPVVVFPAYTHEGRRLGTVESVVRMPPRLELSPETGQPVAVVYENPGRLPGSVSGRFDLVPLPRAASSRTRAVHPRG